LTSRAKGYAPPENMLKSLLIMLPLTIDQICKKKFFKKNHNPPYIINDCERDKDILAAQKKMQVWRYAVQQMVQLRRYAENHKDKVRRYAVGQKVQVRICTEVRRAAEGSVQCCAV